MYIYLLIHSILFYNKGHSRDRTLKTALDNFHIIFSNSHFSINIWSISSKFLGNLLQYLFEGSMSQNFDLGPGYFFMLCRNFGKYFVHYYLRFS